MRATRSSLFSHGKVSRLVVLPLAGAERFVRQCSAVARGRDRRQGRRRRQMTRASKVLAAFVGVILVVLGATSVRTALIEYRSLAGWPQSLPLPTDASGRQPARVSWESASGRVNAWHLVGTNGGGVVLIHG